MAAAPTISMSAPSCCPCSAPSRSGGGDHVRRAGQERRILVERCDAKQMPFADGHFRGVISNSIVHHVPEPAGVLREMVRVLKRRGLLFVRDLMRPPDEKTLRQLVT